MNSYSPVENTVTEVPYLKPLLKMIRRAVETTGCASAD